MDNLKHFIIILLLFSFYKCVVVIPFKTYYRQEPDNFNASDVINYWEKNIIYTNSSIGNPPQKIIMILNSQSFGINLFQHMCDIPDSLYSKEDSNTFYEFKNIHSYHPMKNASIINETLFFYDNINTKELKPLEYMKIIYSDNDEEVQKDSYEYHNNTCINAGLKVGWMYYEDVQTNLISQLKKGFNLETYDFTFNYNSENEGKIIIGAEPHIYDPENFFELQYRIVGSVNGQNDRDWFLNFDNLYQTYKVKSTGEILNETIGLIKTLRIQFDMGLIIGPNDYKNAIKLHFFSDLIKEKKCFEKVVEGKKTVFYCEKSAEEDIKNDFPTLYFEMKQFNKLFELNYKDLFREKNGKFYFLVYFPEYTLGSYFTIGKIFLKKYSFTFNQDTKMIGYYNEDLPGGKKKRNYSESFFTKYKFLIIIVIIVLVIVFGVLGFFLGKLVYDKVRKKRINEVDDNYDYNPQENINENINDNNNEKNNNLIINQNDE
jgi:hypothetical protein